VSSFLAIEQVRSTYISNQIKAQKRIQENNNLICRITLLQQNSIFEKLIN